MAAASALQGIPVAQFSGLAPGLTYYGLDKATGIKWAGARLVPAPVPEGSDPSQAQISSQDAGLVLRVPTAGGGLLDGLCRRQHRTGHDLPGNGSSRRREGMGLAGRRVSTQRDLTGPDRLRPARSGDGQSGSVDPGGFGTGSVPGTPSSSDVVGPLGTGPEALLVADEGIPEPTGGHPA